MKSLREWVKYIICVMPVLFLLSACGISTVGTIPRGTPDTGSGTPAVIPTVQATQPVVNAAPTTAGKFYTYVRKNQLWVALNGAAPMQITNFDYTKTPDVFWHQPIWSPQDRFIALIMNASPVGLGGGGCPGPDYGANGALYVFNTTTHQFVQPALPAPLSNVGMSGAPRMDFWQYMFWEDATHLLAWYNGVPGSTSDAVGLYRFDVMTQTLTRVLALQQLGVGTLYAPRQDAPLMLSMRYSNKQLFYEAVVHPFGQQSQLIIYRHSLSHPETQSNVVLTMGSEPWCAATQSGPYTKPGWDVSLDGEQLVAQMVDATSPNQAVGTVQTLSLMDGSTTALFSAVPAQFLSHDVTLTWGPDNQTVVAASTVMGSQSGLYSATLANPTAIQQYAPVVAGVVSWRTDSTAFALQNGTSTDATTPAAVYVFRKGSTQGQTLFVDAQDFTWG